MVLLVTSVLLVEVARVLCDDDTAGSVGGLEPDKADNAGWNG